MQDAIAILVSRGGLIGHAIYAPELEPLSSQDDSSLSDKGCSLNLHTWNLDIQLKKEKGIQRICTCTSKTKHVFSKVSSLSREQWRRHKSKDYSMELIQI